MFKANRRRTLVIPAKAGIHFDLRAHHNPGTKWIPAFAATTK
jgi:hypothetical protein